jgi:hypothetical protein
MTPKPTSRSWLNPRLGRSNELDADPRHRGCFCSVMTPWCCTIRPPERPKDQLLIESRPNQRKSTTPRTRRNAPSCHRLRPEPVGLSPVLKALHSTTAPNRRRRRPAGHAGESPDQRTERIRITVSRKANRPNVAAVLVPVSIAPRRVSENVSQRRTY